MRLQWRLSTKAKGQLITFLGCFERQQWSSCSDRCCTSATILQRCLSSYNKGHHLLQCVSQKWLMISGPPPSTFCDFVKTGDIFGVILPQFKLAIFCDLFCTPVEWRYNLHLFLKSPPRSHYTKRSRHQRCSSENTFCFHSARSISTILICKQSEDGIRSFIFNTTEHI